MTAIIGLLVLCGIFLLLLLYCRWFLKSWDRKRAEEIEKGTYYDERQIAARGKASECIAGVGIIYYLIVFWLLALWEREDVTPIIAPSSLVMGGVWLSMALFCLCCLMTDALLPLGKYSFPAVLYIAVGVFNIIVVVWGDYSVGMHSNDWDNLIVGFAFLVMGVIHIIARSRSKRNAE